LANPTTLSVVLRDEDDAAGPGLPDTTRATAAVLDSTSKLAIVSSGIKPV
jgi:hypothetical protein